MEIWSLETYDPNTMPGWVKSHYEGIRPYITEFLTSKHPHRNGIMCPFVPKAISEGTIYFTFPPSTEYKAINILVGECISFFNKKIGTGNGAIIIIFPENFSIPELLSIHIQNKVKCIKSFIMLGILYENNSAPSLHSDDYYPLRTPTPTLVLRNITSSDLIFLEPDHYSPITKTIFLTAYIRKFRSKAKKSKFASSQIEIARLARRKQIILITKNLAILTAILTPLLALAAHWL
ncbi:DUF6875 domain-containing protein [Pseudomonas putida]|uniref:DUF6875 domain-containing protein n=1 Tax=Pseudomonas putida TaxID=303 RepID=UPI002FBD7DCA